ncbi:FAD-binding protein [Nocardioides marmoriginsengisoli]|uniref:long-chain-alcohol oxidase n=1 Tax=Nocardioides marmoriginsengisoli TaxID=661483 RepID=A0A3N0CH66_9ACTN|nr:FAD-dependent oxidoreductase [Nocardioides marmoriginsengisoli]RNL62611.1 FAD-binding protein [Nocardioides marmoriginsengisoli]
MTFTDQHLAALRLISDTFAPGDGAVPPASKVGGPEFALELAGTNPRKSELQQLRLVLRLWDTRFLGLVLTGRPRKFSSLDQAGRERVLLSLSDSRVAAKRALFAALKGACLAPYYVTGGPVLWDSIGYAGPPGPLENAPDPALKPEGVTQDESIVCDVVVVGSGAGGGTAAGVLATAGLDVVVLEAGEYHDDRDFDGSERTGFSQLYAGSPGVTSEGQVQLVAGRGLGGGTVVNYTTSFPTPDHVRAEWAALGTPQFATSEYDDAMAAVNARLGVNKDHPGAGVRDRLLEKGAEKIGWSRGAMPRNVIGCDAGIECGRCGMGCRIGAKQSVTKTWLADAAEHGARIYTGARATKVTVENGRATGVAAVSADGHTLSVKARAVVVAAGAIQTPALLKRSGLTNPNIGKHLRLHPATALWGLMPELVNPWEGAMQARYVDEWTDLDGDGYGVLYETAPLTPAFGSGFVNWRGGAEHLRRMRELKNMLGVAIVVRDKGPGGTVKIGKDGEPIVSYTLSPGDTDLLMKGLEGAARIAEAAGATQIYTTHHRTMGYAPGRKGNLESFVKAIRAEGAAPARLTLAALHIMGSARMGGSPQMSAVNPDGETWDVKDLVVADASCFPTASGVNPMISIESIAYMNATRLAARLTR